MEINYFSCLSWVFRLLLSVKSQSESELKKTNLNEIEDKYLKTLPVETQKKLVSDCLLLKIMLSNNGRTGKSSPSSFLCSGLNRKGKLFFMNNCYNFPTYLNTFSVDILFSIWIGETLIQESRDRHRKIVDFWQYRYFLYCYLSVDSVHRYLSWLSNATSCQAM